MNDTNRLLRDKKALRALSDRFRADGKTVVTINGCFDLIHGGHIHILREAAKQGDVVICGLNSDASVRMNKGEGRPILREEERAAILLALEPVDYVFIFQEKECNEFVLTANPHVHVNDASYGEDCVEAPAVRAVGARLHMVPKKEGCSTSNLVLKMKAAGKDG